jgi:hypothetical protein
MTEPTETHSRIHLLEEKPYLIPQTKQKIESSNVVLKLLISLSVIAVVGIAVYVYIKRRKYKHRKYPQLKGPLETEFNVPAAYKELYHTSERLSISRNMGSRQSAFLLPSAINVPPSMKESGRSMTYTQINNYSDHEKDQVHVRPTTSLVDLKRTIDSEEHTTYINSLIYTDSLSRPGLTAHSRFIARRHNEVTVVPGDIVEVMETFENGMVFGYNRTIYTKFN